MMIEWVCFCAVVNRVFKRVMQDKEVTQYFLHHTEGQYVTDIIEEGLY